MHTNSFDLSIEEISKIEGNAGMDVKVHEGKVEELHLKLTDYKRFYTQAVRGKDVVGVPQLVSRICGTCSNAHLLCSIEAAEKALAITPTEQTKTMRRLVNNGLNIRDHGLHLYVFSLPDVLGKDSLFTFDEQNELEHQLLHDTFTVKAAGNQLSIAFGGRSVHAPYPVVGGFSHFPSYEEIEKSVQLLKEARPAAVRLIEVLNKCSFEYIDQTKFASLRSKRYEFLEGEVVTNDGEVFSEEQFPDYLNHKVIPHSQASGYTFYGKPFMVGALSRLNLNKDLIHDETKKSLGNILDRFPSKNVFHNNLAQAIEILHCIDESLEILSSMREFSKEDLAQLSRKDGTGVGLVEAPRGLLLHKYTVRDRKVTEAKIIVPTGMNQISMEKNLKYVVEGNLDKNETGLQFEIEKFIRAYDPCISCATHFLKIRWL